MGVFDDNPFVRVQPASPASEAPPGPDTVARGTGWELVRRDGRNVLDFISGEMAGGGRTLELSEEEAAQLAREGDAAFDRVVNAAEARGRKPEAG